jgi:hypothetical protein
MAVSQSHLAIMDHPLDVPVQPVAFESIGIICPQAAVHLRAQPVMQPHAEHALLGMGTETERSRLWG